MTSFTVKRGIDPSSPKTKINIMTPTKEQHPFIFTLDHSGDFNKGTLHCVLEGDNYDIPVVATKKKSCNRFVFVSKSGTLYVFCNSAPTYIMKK